MEKNMWNGLLVVAVLLACMSTAIAKDWNSDYIIDGYDVVSYFSGSQPTMGSPSHIVEHDGILYAFSNQDNQNEFMNNPEKYRPAYDGNCAFGMVYGKKTTIDPMVWEIVDGRLFFLINHSTEKYWTRKLNKYIKKGDRNWGRINPAS